MVGCGVGITVVALGAGDGEADVEMRVRAELAAGEEVGSVLETDPLGPQAESARTRRATSQLE